MSLQCVKRRQGAITVSRRSAVEYPSRLGVMFRAIRFTPLDIVVDLMYDTIKYYGFSPMFEKIDRGTLTPHYRVIATTEEGKPSKFTVEKETQK